MEATFTRSEMRANLEAATVKARGTGQKTANAYRYGTEDFWYWESKARFWAGEASSWKRALNGQ